MDVYSCSNRPKPSTGLCEIRLLLYIQYVDAAEDIAGDSTFSILRDGTALDRRVGVESRKFGAILQIPEAEAVIHDRISGTRCLHRTCLIHECRYGRSWK